VSLQPRTLRYPDGPLSRFLSCIGFFRFTSHSPEPLDIPSSHQDFARSSSRRLDLLDGKRPTNLRTLQRRPFYYFRHPTRARRRVPPTKLSGLNQKLRATLGVLTLSRPASAGVSAGTFFYLEEYTLGPYDAGTNPCAQLHLCIPICNADQFAIMPHVTPLQSFFTPLWSLCQAPRPAFHPPLIQSVFFSPRFPPPHFLKPPCAGGTSPAWNRPCF